VKSRVYELPVAVRAVMNARQGRRAGQGDPKQVRLRQGRQE